MKCARELDWRGAAGRRCRCRTRCSADDRPQEKLAELMQCRKEQNEKISSDNRQVDQKFATVLYLDESRTTTHREPVAAAKPDRALSSSVQGRFSATIQSLRQHETALFNRPTQTALENSSRSPRRSPSVIRRKPDFASHQTALLAAPASQDTEPRHSQNKNATISFIE